MMKRGRVVSEVSMIQRGAGVHRTVPPGPCWILEGSHWVAVIWHEATERHMAEISVRDYMGMVEDGHLQFDGAEYDTSAAQLGRHRDNSTRTSVLGMRLV